MARSPAFQFYPSDFLADEKVLIMTNQEVGCYIKLLCVSWREGSIPKALPALAALCGESQKTMARLWPHLSACFLPAPGHADRLIHPRLERERTAQAAHRAERSQAGKKGAKSRWSEKRADGSAMAQSCDSHSSVMAQPCDSYGSVMARSCDSHDSAMVLPMAKASSSSSSSSASSNTTPCIGANAPMRCEDPSSLTQAPLPSAEPQQGPSRAPARSKARAESAGAQAWGAYAAAYALRYGVAPVRNARVNAQFGQLVSRLGIEEARHVAAWYVGHNAALYVRSKHAVSLLLRDAEGLHTEWRRRQQVTEADARQVDRKQTTFNAFAPLLEQAAREAEERDRETGGETYAQS